MDGWLREWNLNRGDPDRVDAMAWMGEPTSLVDMPGMQTDAALDELGAPQDDRARSVRFITMMIEHHRGGVAMAEYAAGEADDEAVKEFAQMVATNQLGEIGEYLNLLKGIDPEAAAAASSPAEGGSHPAGDKKVGGVGDHANHGG